MDWYWILLICIGSVAILYGLFAIIVAKKVLQMATTPTKHTLDEARKRQSEVEHIDFAEYDNWNREKFQIEGVHGKIIGEFIYNKTRQDSVPKVAIICHGHTWNRLNSVKYARVFYAKGYNLVIYDHAYFGESEGNFTTLGMYESVDLSKIVDFTRQKFGDAFVGLHGESMGAATVLLVLALRKDIEFVIADCPFSDTMKYYRELCRHAVHLPSFPVVDIANSMSRKSFGYDFKKVKPIDAVMQSDTPICFIHGKEDDFIYPSHSQKMYSVCKNKLSEIHIVEKAGHASSHLVNNETYRKIVGDFVDKVEKSKGIAIE